MVKVFKLSTPPHITASQISLFISLCASIIALTPEVQAVETQKLGPSNP